MGEFENEVKEIDTYEFGSVKEVELNEVSLVSTSDLFEFYKLDAYSIT